MRILSVLILLIFGLSFSSCSRFSSHNSTDTHTLTKSDMMYRSEMVKKPTYKIEVDLASKKEMYSGSVEIEFTVKALNDLRIDFHKGNVKSVRLDGIPHTDYTYNDIFILV